MNKLHLQQGALAQAHGEGFWQTQRKLKAQNGGDVKSGHVLTTLKNKINLPWSQKPAKGSCIPKFVTPFPGFAHPLVASFKGREMLNWCQVDNPSLFGEHLHLPTCVTNQPLLTENHRQCVPCSFPSLTVQPAHTCLCWGSAHLSDEYSY